MCSYCYRGKELPAPITSNVLAHLGRGDTRLVLAEIELVESDIEVRRATQLLRNAVQNGQAVCMRGSINVSTIDLSQLDAALSSAQSAGVLAGAGRSLLLTAVLLRKMRAALLAGPDWHEACLRLAYLPLCGDAVYAPHDPWVHRSSRPGASDLRGFRPPPPRKVFPSSVRFRRS